MLCKWQACRTTELCHVSGAGTTSHLCLHQLGDVGLSPNVVFNAIESTFQGGTTHQQDEQDDIWEECGKVDNLQNEMQGHILEARECTDLHAGGKAGF